MKHLVAFLPIVALSSLVAGAGCGGRVVEDLSNANGGGTSAPGTAGPTATTGVGGSGAVAGVGVTNATTGVSVTNATGVGGFQTSGTTTTTGIFNSTSTTMPSTSAFASSGATVSTGFGGAASVGSTNPSSSNVSGVGGTGGAGGAPSIGLIDNMDNGGNQIDHVDGRKGYWYTYNDKTPGGMQTPSPQAAFTMTPIPASAPIPGHMLAANTFGGGFTTWGAALGVDLNNDGITVAAYDASKYQGVRFWARVGPNADAGGHVVRFQIQDITTASQGGVCDPSSSGANACFDGFGANITLSPDWQEWSFPWAALTQVGWGEVAPAITSKAIYSMEFETGSTDSFDTWIYGLELF